MKKQKQNHGRTGMKEAPPIMKDQSPELRCTSCPPQTQNTPSKRAGKRIEGQWGRPKTHGPLNGLVTGAVFRYGGGARKQPSKQTTEMPTSTMALLGGFPPS